MQEKCNDRLVVDLTDSKRTRHGHEQAPPKSKAIVGRDRLTWRKEGTRYCLCHRGGRALVSVEPDSKYPNMFRVRYSNGKLSDFVNLTRAKDAAATFALRRLNSWVQESAAERAAAHPKSIRVPKEVAEPTCDFQSGLT